MESEGGSGSEEGSEEGGAGGGGSKEEKKQSMGNRKTLVKSRMYSDEVGVRTYEARRSREAIRSTTKDASRCRIPSKPLRQGE